MHARMHKINSNSNFLAIKFAEGNKLKAKAEDNLDAKLEATISAMRANKKSTVRTRINWEVEPYFSLRKRVADAWINQNDFYVAGDSMYSFCERTTLSRAVLIR